MVILTFTIEGIDALLHEGEAALEHLGFEARKAVQDAADAGIAEAQQNHPYTDRTFKLSGTARATNVESASGRYTPFSDMRWKMKYASFVDQGTKRSKPYPFADRARARALASLERGLESAVRAFVDRVNR